jgi:hypothetical protein
MTAVLGLYGRGGDIFCRPAWSRGLGNPSSRFYRAPRPLRTLKNEDPTLSAEAFKIQFNLQMSVKFCLSVSSGLNVLCCFRPTRSTEEPESIHQPAATTLEPLARPSMQLTSDLSTAAAIAQAPNELPSGQT